MGTAARLNIETFLKQRRLAMVGVARGEREFSRKLMDEFVRRGYDVVPVNPNAETIGGRECYARLQDIQPPVEAALLMVPRANLMDLLPDCRDAGIKQVWFYGINGPGDVSASALEYCDASGISVIPGYCPFMFFERTGFIHRLHGGIMKLMGTHPGQA